MQKTGSWYRLFKTPSWEFSALMASSSLPWRKPSGRGIDRGNLKLSWKWSESVSHTLQPHGLSSPWNSPGQNTEVGSLPLLQSIFPTQGLNPGLLHCRRILYQLSHKARQRILEWVAYPFSSGSSWPRSQTRVPCITGRFFTSWAIREAHLY